MEIKDILLILFFVIPGVIAEKISNLVDIPKDNKRSEFGELINGVLWSFPIVFITGIIAHVINRYDTLTEYINAFDYPKFTLTFSIGLVLITIIFGIIKGKKEDDFYIWVNKIRTDKLGRIEIDNKTCWRKLFLDSNESHYLVIKKGEEEYRGFTKWYSTPDEEKEIVLYEAEVLMHYPEYKKKFNKVKYTYVNIEKEIVIEDYDMSEYNDWVEELINKNQEQ